MTPVKPTGDFLAKDGILCVTSQIVNGADDVTSVEEGAFLEAAKEEGKENTIVAKLVVFAAIVHGWYKFSPKAFDAWLADDFGKRTGGDKRVPMLANHNMSKLIGSWTDVMKVPGGIMVAGDFSGTEYAQNIRTLALEGHLRATSFGIRIISSKEEADYKEKGYGEIITEAALREGSLTALPAVPAAKIKMVASEKDDEQGDEGMTEEEIRIVRDILARQEQDLEESAMRGTLAASRALRESMAASSLN